MRLVLVVFIVTSLAAALSPAPLRADQVAEDLCATMLVDMIEGAGLTPERSAPALGCRQDTDGTWRMPTVSELTDTANTIALDATGARLLTSVDAFSTSHALASTFQYVRNDQALIIPGPGGQPDITDISD